MQDFKQFNIMWCYLCLPVVFCVYCLWKWRRSLPRVDGIHKKCVFITGCDSGFGNALARRLDVLGVPVFAGCLTETGASQLRENCSQRLQTVIVDVTSHSSILEAFQFVKDNIPLEAGLWGIVNNAGVFGNSGTLEYMTRADFTTVYDVNLIGLIDVTQTFLPLLKQSRGRVVNTASAIAIVPAPFYYPYMTSKHAVRAFSAAFGLEKKPYGIKVACVMPGMFSTNIVTEEVSRRKSENQWEALSQDVKEEFDNDYHAAMLEAHLKVFTSGPSDLTPVTNDCEHALFAKNPLREYFPGTDAFVFSWSLLFSPSFHILFFENTFLRPFRDVQMASLQRQGNL